MISQPKHEETFEKSVILKSERAQTEILDWEKSLRMQPPLTSCSLRIRPYFRSEDVNQTGFLITSLGVLKEHSQTDLRDLTLEFVLSPDNHPIDTLGSLFYVLNGFPNLKKLEIRSYLRERPTPRIKLTWEKVFTLTYEVMRLKSVTDLRLDFRDMIVDRQPYVTFLTNLLQKKNIQKIFLRITPQKEACTEANDPQKLPPFGDSYGMTPTSARDLDIKAMRPYPFKTKITDLYLVTDNYEGTLLDCAKILLECFRTKDYLEFLGLQCTSSVTISMSPLESFKSNKKEASSSQSSSGSGRIYYPLTIDKDLAKSVDPRIHISDSKNLGPKDSNPYEILLPSFTVHETNTSQELAWKNLEEKFPLVLPKGSNHDRFHREKVFEILPLLRRFPQLKELKFELGLGEADMRRFFAEFSLALISKEETEKKNKTA